MNNFDQWVDLIILAMDGAWRSGATSQEIAEAIVDKQSKNEGRRWPDWRTADPEKAIEHKRTELELAEFAMNEILFRRGIIQKPMVQP